MKKPNELAAKEKMAEKKAKQDEIKNVLSELEIRVRGEMDSGVITASGGTFEWPNTDDCEDPEIMQSIKTYFAQHGWKFAYKKVEEEGWSMTACSSTSWTEYHFTITPRKGDAGGD